MSIAEEQNKDFKEIFLQNFGRIIESSPSNVSDKSKLEYGKYIALKLISIASIGLVIGFLISLLF